MLTSLFRSPKTHRSGKTAIPSGHQSMEVSSRNIWPVSALIAIYLGSIALVCLQGPRPIIDEWAYIDAARHFSESGVFVVSPISFAPSLFEAIYGGAVLSLFDGSLIALIMSTGILGGAAGIALWDLLLRSGVPSIRAALVVGVFLFGGVFFSLSTTFMTDVHALSLIVIASAFYSRGVDDGRNAPWWLVGGSLAASAAYLSRPGAIAVVAGVALVAICRRQRSALLWALGLPLLTLGAHLVLQSVGALPSLRSDLLDRLATPSLATSLDALTITAITIGIWLFPLVPLAGSAYVNSPEPRLTRLALASSAVIMFAGLVWSRGLPVVGHWLNRTGLYPIDESTVGGRPTLVSWSYYVAIAIAAILLCTIALTRALMATKKPELRAAEIGLWAVAGTSLPLVLFTQVAAWERMIDRYLLVLLPAVLFSVVVRWLVRAPRRFEWGGWSMLCIVALLSIVLAVDGMRLQDAVFRSAEAAVARGIDLTEIDGGAAWTGDHFGLAMRPEAQRPTNGQTWWRDLFAPGIDPRFEVTINPGDDACSLHEVDPNTLLSTNRVGLIDSDC